MNKTPLYSILVFIAGASYGLLVPIAKSAVEAGVHPSTCVPLQYLVAFVVMLVVMFIRRVKWARPKRLLSLSVLGFLAAGNALCYYTSVSLLPSSAALTLLFQYIWISVLIECVLKRKLPERSTLLAIAIVLVGTVFATGLLDGTFVSLDPIGVIAGFGAALFYALFLYYSGTLSEDRSTALKTTMLAAGGVVCASIASPTAYTTSFFDPTAWPYIVSLAFFGILLPTSLINFASPKLSTGIVSIMASSELPVGILAAWALVGDTPTPLVLFGAALILVGIIVKQTSSSQERPAPHRQ